MSKTQTTAPAAAAKATTASGSLSVPAPTAPPPTVGGIPLLKNKTLEEILNKWSTDLESYTQEFRSQATELQKWDRTILENGATISRLYEELQSTESLQREIDQNLEYIEAQQNELDSTLDSYHAQIKALFQSEAQSTHLRTTPADEERERAYTLAENLNKQLDEMSQQLSVIIDDMNASRSGGTSGVAGDVMPATVTAGKPVAPEDDNPIGAIVRILNEHLTSLEWIDKTSNDLASRIVELKRVGTEATEQADRVHRGQSGIAIGPGSVVAPLGGTFGSTPSRLRPTSGFGATTPGGR
ncbi:FG-nucleoporin nsp1 [Polyrhizophydium stewartii]|uniref:FG-nucleoporin nsp1 n=1 Tax=Polyrhizophydium stewartii TaxID=2732419 RepID=A0ABR4N6Q6_9FUNG